MNGSVSGLSVLALAELMVHCIFTPSEKERHMAVSLTECMIFWIANIFKEMPELEDYPLPQDGLSNNSVWATHQDLTNESHSSLFESEMPTSLSIGSLSFVLPAIKEEGEEVLLGNKVESDINVVEESNETLVTKEENLIQVADDDSVDSLEINRLVICHENSTLTMNNEVTKNPMKIEWTSLVDESLLKIQLDPQLGIAIANELDKLNAILLKCDSLIPETGDSLIPEKNEPILPNGHYSTLTLIEESF